MTRLNLALDRLSPSHSGCNRSTRPACLVTGLGTLCRLPILTFLQSKTGWRFFREAQIFSHPISFPTVSSSRLYHPARPVAVFLLMVNLYVAFVDWSCTTAINWALSRTTSQIFHLHTTTTCELCLAVRVPGIIRIVQKSLLPHSRRFGRI